MSHGALHTIVYSDLHKNPTRFLSRMRKSCFPVRLVFFVAITFITLNNLYARPTPRTKDTQWVDGCILRIKVMWSILISKNGNVSGPYENNETNEKTPEIGLYMRIRE